MITIGFIVDLLKTLAALKKAVFGQKNDSSGLRLARVKNQRENKLDQKNAAFYSFSRRRNFYLKRKKIYYVNNFG